MSAKERKCKSAKERKGAEISAKELFHVKIVNDQVLGTPEKGKTHNTFGESLSPLQMCVCSPRFLVLQLSCFSPTLSVLSIVLTIRLFPTTQRCLSFNSWAMGVWRGRAHLLKVFRAARLQNEAAPEKHLNRYKKKKREKGSEKKRSDLQDTKEYQNQRGT